MKTCWRSGGIAPHILNICTRWRRGQLHDPAALCWYLLDRRLGGLQSRSRHGDEEKKSQTLPDGNRTPGCPARTYSLYWIKWVV